MTKTPQSVTMVIEVIFMFNDFYNIYKSARDASWRFLIDYNITQLPVNLKPITDKLNIKVKFGDERVLNPGQKGLTITDGVETYIVVRKGISTAETRYIIIHELGHGYLGHPLIDGKYARTFDVDKQYEYEAERFAIDVLAPACVLWGLNLHTAEDIARVCNISITSAQRRAERMRILYDRNMFLSHPLERQVFSQFKNFIDSQNK